MLKVLNINVAINDVTTRSSKVCRWGIGLICLVLWLTFLPVTGEAKKQKMVEVTLDNLEIVYREAEALLQSNKLYPAKERFEKIAYTFPYTDYAERSALAAAYISYEMKDEDSTIATLTVFLETYDDTPYRAYALYFLGMLQYAELQYSNISVESIATVRDVFRHVLNLPNNQAYRKVAEQKVKELNEQIIRNQISIGDHYLDAGNLAAALKRYLSIWRELQTLPAAGVGHHQKYLAERLAHVFTVLGLESEQQYWQEQMANLKVASPETIKLPD